MYNKYINLFIEGIGGVNMGDVVYLKSRVESDSEGFNSDTKMSSIASDFFDSAGKETNTELNPAYIITFKNASELSWDGCVTGIKRLAKSDSYMGMLGSGTCGLYQTDNSNVVKNGIIANMDSDIKDEVQGSFSIILVFDDELEDWVFESLGDGTLFISVT